MNRIHPKGNVNVCDTFHGKPSNGFGDVSLKTANVNLVAALGGKVIQESPGDREWLYKISTTGVTIHGASVAGVTRTCLISTTVTAPQQNKKGTKSQDM